MKVELHRLQVFGIGIRKYNNSLWVMDDKRKHFQMVLTLAKRILL